MRRSRLITLAMVAAVSVVAVPARLIAAAPTAGTLASAQDWPHTIQGQNGSVTVYTPQVIDWPGRTELDARVVVSLLPKGTTTPILGTLEITGTTETDQASRIVTVSGFKLKSSHFPSLDTSRAAGLDQKIQAALASMPPKPVPLDLVLLSLRQAAPDIRPVAVSNTPPAIYYSAGPASLVVFDSDPVLAPITGSKLARAVNTNWDVFFDGAGKQWYLLNNGSWFSAPDFKGPWAPHPALPAAFSALAKNPDFPDLHGKVPGKPANPVPKIIVSTEPAEIIVTDGPAAWSPVPQTSLQVVTNTASAVFRDTGGKIYYLVSGRWFSAPGFDGPWTFASDSLPADFANIPPSAPVASVLASVPGTEQAQDAIIQAQVPVQATLSRQTATLKPSYAGPPNFAPIPSTKVAYATNTSYPVFQVGSVYYACWQGAWFTAPTPNGPFVLAAAVPPEIYEIPPASPYYPVTYVRVYGATPTAVTYGYTAGYALGFITAATLVYGTGYYYPPVIIPGPVPAYFAYPYSYAGAVYYNPYNGAWARGGAVYGPYYGARGGTYYNPGTGGWARGGAVYGPYGGAGAWSAYNPATGRYSHGSASWGPYGGAANASFYNPATGVSGSTSQHGNGYSRWGSSVVSGPNKTVNTASARNPNGAAGAFSSSTGAKGAAVHGSNGNNAAAVKGRNGNVYAGADGNVYRKDSSGWSKYDNGSWSSVQRPSGSAQNDPGGSQHTFSQLDNDNRARTQGYARQQQYNQARFGGGRFGGGYEGGAGVHGFRR